MGWPPGQKNGQKWPFFGLWGVQVENDFSIKCPTDAQGQLGKPQKRTAIPENGPSALYKVILYRPNT